VEAEKELIELDAVNFLTRQFIKWKLMISFWRPF
jgi:hypothetical protein